MLYTSIITGIRLHCLLPYLDSMYKRTMLQYKVAASLAISAMVSFFLSACVFRLVSLGILRALYYLESTVG